MTNEDKDLQELKVAEEGHSRIMTFEEIGRAAWEIGGESIKRWQREFSEFSKKQDGSEESTKENQ